jgi:signal peptidase I
VADTKEKAKKKTRPKVLTKRQKTLKSVRTFLIYAAIFIFLRVWVVEANVIPSGSMKDSLLVGDYLLVEKISIYAGGPHRGDIATFDYPFIKLNIFQRTWRFASKLWGGGNWGPKLLIKRVIGEPGDTILIKNAKLYVNGSPLDEPYLKDDAGADFGPITVPDGYYYMMGDNRYDSADSRFIGAVPRKVIRGKARITYFSLIPTTCPKHGVPIVRTPDGKLRCAYDGEIMRKGYDAIDASPLRLDERIRWFRIGMLLW